MAGAIVEPEPDACQCGHAHAHAHGGHDAAAADDAPPTRLAQQLWMPWRAIVMNPLLTAAVYTVFNVVFMSIWLLVSLLVWLLTLPGLLLVVVSAIFFGLRAVTQYVSYPGQLALVVRDGETNFARLSKRRLTMAIDAAHELAQTLGDAYVAPAGSAAAQQRRMRFLQRHQNHEFSIETLVVPLLRALEQVEKDGNLGMNGARLLSALQDLVTFSTHDLGKHTAELVSASAKEFELRRQQLFLTTSKLATPASTPASTPKTGLTVTSSPVSLTPSSSSSQRQQQLQLVPGRLVVTLEEKLARVRDVLPLIGPSAAVANAKRDFSWILRELCRRKPVEVDIITTLDLIRADLSVRFHGEQVWIPGHNDHQIDAMFVPAAGGFSVDKPVMVLCNPNGGLYEFHHFQMDWVKFYTDLECHVLLFNYRGYGRCAGVPSPWAHNLDALAIVDYLKARKGLKKIGVHGESIGGLVATFLARQSDAISVLVADRTFASLPALAQRLVASWAGRAVNWLTWWETDNAGNYLAATCPKLLCSDPNDEIISDGASLKSGVALRVELGDQTFDLPRPVPLNEYDLPDEDGSAPSSLSDFMPFLSRCPTIVTGEKRVRRRSEAETRPQAGAPLSDVMVRRFSEASLSLGRRAMRYAEARDTSASRISSGTHVEISVLDSSSTAVAPPSASFPQELLAAMWMQIASLDGYCGQCFLQAAESGGYDRIRAWTVSMLTWGGQLPPPKRTQLTLEAFDRQGLVIRPLTIFQVHQAFQSAVEQHPGMKFDLDIAVVLEMVEYIMDSLQRRWKLQEETNLTAKSPGLAAVTGTPRALGRLLALHCGHNRQFADNEKAELVDFLRSADFLPATKS